MRMKLIITQEDDEDNDHLKRTMLVDEAFGLLWEIDQDICRRTMKYDENVSDATYKVLEEIREAICDSGLMKHYN